MSGYKITSALTDGLLRFVALGGVLTTAAIAPNALQLLDKPIKKYFNSLDERAQQREYQRILRNMRRQNLIEYKTDDYEHGLVVTKKGRKRAEKANVDHLQIIAPNKWDKRWRIVFFDIPERHKAARDYLSRKLKEIGFIQLQRSVWVHPFPCRPEMEAVTTAYDVTRYVTYIETSYIDSEDRLRDRFASILK